MQLVASLSPQKTWIQSQATPRGICGGKCGNETGSALSISVLPCQYHYTNAKCSLIHKLSTLRTAYSPINSVIT